MANHILKHTEPESNIYHYAIHCGEEFYVLILLLNSSTGMKLKRNREDLTFRSTKASFMAYSYFDKKNDFNVWFITIFQRVLGLNKKTIRFSKMTMKTFFLLPEIGSVDYILKFSGDEPIFTQLLTKISSIKEIVSIYEVPKKRLKSKENLIFEY
jgi:hypothetical protein